MRTRRSRGRTSPSPSGRTRRSRTPATTCASSSISCGRRCPTPIATSAPTRTACSGPPDSSFSLDVALFDRAVAEAEEAGRAGDAARRRACLERAVDLCQGPLLPSCYDDWIGPARERLARRCEDAVAALVGLLEEQREYASAIARVRHWLQHDPLDEEALPLADAAAGAGRRSGGRAPGLSPVRRRAPPGARRGAERRDRPRLRADPRRRARPRGVLRSGARGRPAAPPLVGRQAEWARLREAWERAVRGPAGFALVTGDAGIGKSRLAEELLTWAQRQGVATARTRSYAAEGRLSLAPVSEWLRSDALSPHLARLEDVWRVEVARILPELLAARPDLPRPAPMTEFGDRLRFFEGLARAVLAAPQPLLLLIDDLQWCDRETIEWLHFLSRFDPEARLLVLGTARSEELGRRAPAPGAPPAPAQRVAAHRDRARAAGRGGDGGAGGPGREPGLRRGRGHPALSARPRAIRSSSWRRCGPRAAAAAAGRPRAGDRRASAPRARGDRRPPGPALGPRPGDGGGRGRDRARLRPGGPRAPGGRRRRGRARARRALAEAHRPRAGAERLRLHPRQAAGRGLRRDERPPAAPAAPARGRGPRRRCTSKDLDPVSAQIAAHYESAGLFEQAIPHYSRAAVVAQGVYAHDEAIGPRRPRLVAAPPAARERAARRLGARAPARPRPELSGDHGLGGPGAGRRARPRARPLRPRGNGRAARADPLRDAVALHRRGAAREVRADHGRDGAPLPRDARARSRRGRRSPCWRASGSRWAASRRPATTSTASSGKPTRASSSASRSRRA